MRNWLLVLLLMLTTPLFATNAEAIFAGGCFWCMQADFDKLPGVIKTIAGYDGGTTPNPSYTSVSMGTTNYAESVKVIFDPKLVSYQQLVDYFWHHIDPTTQNKEFCDEGRQYRSAIFYLNNEQKQIAEDSKQELAKKFPGVFTEIVPATSFYAAEDYHQNYYKKNPLRYKYYRWRCARDQRVQEVWK